MDSCSGILSDTSKDVFEIIKTLASCGVAITLYIAFRQWTLNVKAFEAAHKRAAAEKAVTLSLEFARTLGPKWCAATKIVGALDVAKTKALEAGEPFSVPASSVDLLLAALPSRTVNDPARGNLGPECLTATEVFELRWTIISYLNELEGLCLAAVKGVADEKLIAKELAGLYRPANNQNFCRMYRDISGGETDFPALTEFLARHFPGASSGIEPLHTKPI